MSRSRPVAVELPFDFGAKVNIDADESIVATVLAFAYYRRGLEIQVGWFHAGDAKTAWFDSCRLSLAEQK